jgi:hypothetical protein
MVDGFECISSGIHVNFCTFKIKPFFIQFFYFIFLLIFACGAITWFPLIVQNLSCENEF